MIPIPRYLGSHLIICLGWAGFYCCSVSNVWLFATPWTAELQASLSFTISRNLLKLMSIKSVMPSNHLVLCDPLLLLPSVFPSIRVFSNELAVCFRWPKYWSFSCSISPSNEHSGLISFKIDRFDLLAVQGTLKSLLQHHNLKASVLQADLVTWLLINMWPKWWAVLLRLGYKDSGSTSLTLSHSFPLSPALSWMESTCCIVSCPRGQSKWQSGPVASNSHVSESGHGLFSSSSLRWRLQFCEAPWAKWLNKITWDSWPTKTVKHSSMVLRNRYIIYFAVRPTWVWPWFHLHKLDQGN